MSITRISNEYDNEDISYEHYIKALWWGPPLDDESHLDDTIRIDFAPDDGISIVHPGFNLAEVILAVLAAADSLRTMYHRSVRSQLGQDAGTQGTLSAGQDQDGAQAANDPEPDSRYVTIRRALGGGLVVDITGFPLDEASRTMEMLARRVQVDQPKVRVVSAGHLVGRYQKRAIR